MSASLTERLIAAHRLQNQGTPALLEGDHAFALAGQDTVEAAVLIAITDRAEPGVILTKRPQSMRKHAGQVAFPGGRVDPEDTDIIAAALREAHEEVALDPAIPVVQILADPYFTITNYRITPVIARIPPDLPLVANPTEVDAIFEAPLSHVLDPANHEKVAVDWHGQKRYYYEIHWDEFRIWGATAAMIVNLSRRMAWLG
jgi:8-oxo-dGTP pyrophosphatase MutT (NUDIX family)